MAMQTMVSAATPHQTSARRCVMVRAMKSLMRMSKRTIQHESASRCNAQPRDAISEAHAANALQYRRLMTVGRLCETLFQSVASAVLSGKPGSKAEQKSLAAADVSQRLLIRRAKELIA